MLRFRAACSRLFLLHEHACRTIKSANSRPRRRVREIGRRGMSSSKKNASLPLAESSLQGVCSSSSDQRKYQNRLLEEASPYLLQHAHNPVDWYPWGEAAFSKARSEMKPIFLSIGYSTCHWCHVMEHESFENEETAKVLNAEFVAIKVDREERPDVDRVYMSYVQATSGHGGWPMSVFLTPDLKPFFGGTYFPPEARYGMPAFKNILASIAATWKNKRELVLEQSEETLQELSKHLVKRNPLEADADVNKAIDRFINGCTESLVRTFDRAHGGFGGAPKFPRPSELFVLLTNSLRLRVRDPVCKELDASVGAILQASNDKKATEMIDMVKFTLEKMSNGGIYDHIGGGFHRYSVDELWHVPHFEKMLYDNPQIALAYLHMYQYTRASRWAGVACGILDYLKREMTDPLGGLYSAEDADSLDEAKGKKTEGAFYVWTASELQEILDEKEYKVFSTYYNIHPSGNCNKSERSDPHGEFIAKNCLLVTKSVEDAVSDMGIDPKEANSILAECRRKVYAARKQRPKPSLDDKVVTAWNGMAVCAFAQASSILDSASVSECFPVEGHSPSTYLEDAKKIANFIVQSLWDEKHQVLKRAYCNGVSSIEGYADDYAWTIAGFLDLYEHSGERTWLQWAMKLQQRMDEIFFDHTSGGYFSTSGNDPSILLRLKEEYDSAEPTASSIAVSNLVRLSLLLSSKSAALMEKARMTIQSFTSRLEKMPSALPQLAFSAYLYEAYPSSKKIVICGSMEDSRTAQLVRTLHKNYMPSKAVIFVDLNDAENLWFWRENSADNLRVLGDIVDWRDGDQSPIVLDKDMEPTAYVCANFTCKAPTPDPDTLERQLSASRIVPVEFDFNIFQKKSS